MQKPLSTSVLKHEKRGFRKLFSLSNIQLSSAVRAFTLLPMFRSRERADSRIQNFSSVKPSSVKNPDFLPAAGGNFLGYISQLWWDNHSFERKREGTSFAFLRVLTSSVTKLCQSTHTSCQNINLHTISLKLTLNSISNNTSIVKQIEINS